jgi:hypothetical protein
MKSYQMLVDRGLSQIKTEVLHEFKHKDAEKIIPYLHEFSKITMPGQEVTQP